MAKSKKILKAKEPVRLRVKELSNGNRSLYLDIYREGHRSYEFLKLYLVPETSEAAKQQNAKILQDANAIKAQRVIELADSEAGLSKASSRSKMLLLDWMEQYKADQIKRGKKDFRQISFTIKLLKSFRGSHTMMKEVDKSFCLGFLDYVQNVYVSDRKPYKKLCPFTARNYYRCLNSALNAAVRADVILENPYNKISDVDKIKLPESQREYLTIDEVKTLISTDCKSEAVKQIYLFSCYCGLRISDIEDLTWGDVVKDGDQYRIEKTQIKTKNSIYLPLSKQALKWMPERNGAAAEDHVFTEQPSQSYGNIILKDWAKAAGISKKVSYHTARHTFATMMLTLGADLYTTSKLLGHTEVSTTQIYAKIVDSKKVDAVNLADSVFD